MPGKPINDTDDYFVEKLMNNDVLDDLGTQLKRYGLDENSINELINGLRERHTNGGAILKLSEALGMEPTQNRIDKDLDGGTQSLKADCANYNQPGLEKITDADDFSCKTPDENTGRCTSAVFSRTVGIISQNIINIGD